MSLPHASHVLGVRNVGVNKTDKVLASWGPLSSREIDINPLNHYSITVFLNAMKERKERKGVQ